MMIRSQVMCFPTTVQEKCDLSRRHFFLVAVHLHFSSRQKATTVPVILVGDSIVPSKVTVGGCFGPSVGGFSQVNSTLSPFTAPLNLCSPNFPEYVPLSLAPACLKTSVEVKFPLCSADRSTVISHVPVMSAAFFQPLVVINKPPSKTTISN